MSAPKSISDLGDAWYVFSFLRNKYQAQAQESGYYHAARNLRKQGYPLEIARAILL